MSAILCEASNRLISSARLEELFSTNAAPYPHEVPFLQTLLETHTTSIAQLTSAKCTAQDRVAERLDAHSTYSRCCASALSPIRRLPCDVLLHIFFHCHLLDVAWMHPRYAAELLQDSSLLRISHVCSSWRAIAIHTPMLWKDISLFFSHWGCTRGQVALQKLWLHRSRRAPLSVSLASVTPNSPVRIFQVFHVPFCRIRSLTICLPPGDADQILSLPPGAFPNLECLAIDTSRGPQSRRDCRMTAFQRAPRLKALTLENYQRRLEPSDFPWTQLHCLALLWRSMALHPFQHILACCVELERLQITIEDCVMLTEPSASSCKLATMPRLETLECNSTIPVDHFLGPLTAPALTGVTITRGYSHIEKLGIFSWPGFQVLASHTAFLRTLVLRDVRIPGCCPLALLAEVPTVEELTAHRVLPLTAPLFGALTLRDGDTPLLPRLRVLDLATDALLESDIKEVAAMVRSRWHACRTGGQLRRFCLGVRGVVDAELGERLRECVEEGLVLCVGRADHMFP